MYDHTKPSMPPEQYPPILQVEPGRFEVSNPTDDALVQDGFTIAKAGKGPKTAFGIEEGKVVKKIPLVECFGPTIQGEGALIGAHTYFLRFGLCDYKCAMCDSMHAVDPSQVRENAKWLTQDEIFSSFLDRATCKGAYVDCTAPWVTLSGGNPCIHDLGRLVVKLRKSSFKVAVETQGTFAPAWLDQCQVITCSPKGPGMGERFDEVAFDKFVTQLDYHEGLNIKVVIFDQRDLEFACMVFERVKRLMAHIPPLYLSLGNPFPPHIIAPQAQTIESVRINGQILRDHLCDQYLSLLEEIQQNPILMKARFLPQWHVLLWGNRKGV